MYNIIIFTVKIYIYKESLWNARGVPVRGAFLTFRGARSTHPYQSIDFAHSENTHNATMLRYTRSWVNWDRLPVCATIYSPRGAVCALWEIFFFLFFYFSANCGIVCWTQRALSTVLGYIFSVGVIRGTSATTREDATLCVCVYNEITGRFADADQLGREDALSSTFTFFFFYIYNQRVRVR